MAELLLEILSEEIPARMQRPAAEQLRAAMEERLKKENLFNTGVKTFVTPRRLVLSVGGLSLTQEDKTEEKRGPRTDANPQALEGFLKSSGLRLEQLTKRQTDKGEFYFAVTKQKGQPTRAILKAALSDIVPAMSWPKSMRWNNRPMRWVRPIQNVLCVFGGEVLDFRLGHLEANNETEGHRFLAKGRFAVNDLEDYRKGLEERSVILDPENRKERIRDQAQALAKSRGLALLEDAGLLDEVAGLVEYPVVLMGAIDTAYMDVPEEALVCSIRSHQKYFCTRDKSGKLAPWFLVASNMKTTDNGAKIIAGNERVLRARLADAKFFWDQDRRVKLDARLPMLGKVTFHAKLGTVGEKSEHIAKLCRLIAAYVPGADAAQAERAGLLCKADLVSGMVGEFPELQGIMGAYYASETGEHDAIAAAIREHYAPVGPSDTCPKAPVSIVVAIADKIDTLVGMFAAGEKPTGSKDPFALRRAALGLIRLILENQLSVPLRTVIEKALKQYPKSLLVQHDAPEVAEENKNLLGKLLGKKTKPEDVINELLVFFEDRLKASLKAENARHDLITAVFSGGNEDDLLRAVRRVSELDKFLGSEDGSNLLAAYKRAVNIVAIEEKKDGKKYDGAPSKGNLEQVEEQTLFDAMHSARPEIKAALKDNRFALAMEKVATLRQPIDRFFDSVTVNTDNPDLRKNRLRLLAQMRELLDEIADFSKISG